ncbi:MAG TPA: class E sortase [Acidimicrobiales bacterium]|nr:class E sortase [Acidimicrobiales bacterium]
MDRLIEYLRSHQWARRGLSVLSVALLAGAVGLLGYPLYTNFYQGRVQDRLTDELASPELQEKYRQRRIEVGDSLTRIQIPKINVDTIVVEGTTASALRAGAGHYPSTPLPCENGNVGIAGHRTTYGKPFANLDQLKEGDTIILTTPIGTCTYAVSKQPFVISPSNLDVISDTPTTRELTLTTCHPKHSARQRLVIKATYVSGEPGTA